LVEAEAGTELCAVVAAVLDEEADARVGAVDDEPFFSPSPPFSFRDGVGRLPPVDVCCCCPPLAGWLPVCFDPDAVLDAVPLGAVGVGAGAERAEWDSTVPAVVDADGCFFSLGGGSAGACSSPLPIFSTWISGASSELSLPGEELELDDGDDDGLASDECHSGSVVELDPLLVSLLPRVRLLDEEEEPLLIPSFPLICAWAMDWTSKE